MTPLDFIKFVSFIETNLEQITPLLDDAYEAVKRFSDDVSEEELEEYTTEWVSYNFDKEDFQWAYILFEEYIDYVNRCDYEDLPCNTNYFLSKFHIPK